MDHRVKAMPPHRKVSFDDNPTGIITFTENVSRQVIWHSEKKKYPDEPFNFTCIRRGICKYFWVGWNKSFRGPEAEEIYFVLQTGPKEMFIFFTAPSFILGWASGRKKMHIFMKIINFWAKCWIGGRFTRLLNRHGFSAMGLFHGCYLFF